jgi:uncharacterized protein YqgC (DUF456 family)
MNPAVQGLTLVVTVIVMIIGTFAAFLPLVPGPLLVWFGVVLYAVATGFHEVTLPATVLLTLLMLLGITSDFWLSALSVKSAGGSLWGVLGGALGGLIGVFVLFPVGSMIGAVIGTLALEYMVSGNVRRSLRSGGVTLGSYLLSVLVEFVAAVLMDAVFVGCLLLAQR